MVYLCKFRWDVLLCKGYKVVQYGIVQNFVGNCNLMENKYIYK